MMYRSKATDDWLPIDDDGYLPDGTQVIEYERDEDTKEIYRMVLSPGEFRGRGLGSEVVGR